MSRDLDYLSYMNMNELELPIYVNYKCEMIAEPPNETIIYKIKDESIK